MYLYLFSQLLLQPANRKERPISRCDPSVKVCRAWVMEGTRSDLWASVGKHFEVPMPVSLGPVGGTGTGAGARQKRSLRCARWARVDRFELSPVSLHAVRPHEVAPNFQRCAVLPVLVVLLSRSSTFAHHPF